MNISSRAVAHNLPDYVLNYSEMDWLTGLAAQQLTGQAWHKDHFSANLPSRLKDVHA